MLWVVCSAEKFQLLISFKDRVARGIKQNFFVEFLYDQAWNTQETEAIDSEL